MILAGDSHLGPSNTSTAIDCADWLSAAVCPQRPLSASALRWCYPQRSATPTTQPQFPAHGWRGRRCSAPRTAHAGRMRSHPAQVALCLGAVPLGPRGFDGGRCRGVSGWCQQRGGVGATGGGEANKPRFISVNLSSESASLVQPPGLSDMREGIHRLGSLLDVLGATSYLLLPPHQIVWSSSWK